MPSLRGSSNTTHHRSRASRWPPKSSYRTSRCGRYGLSQQAEAERAAAQHQAELMMAEQRAQAERQKAEQQAAAEEGGGRVAAAERLAADRAAAAMAAAERAAAALAATQAAMDSRDLSTIIGPPVVPPPPPQAASHRPRDESPTSSERSSSSAASGRKGGTTAEAPHVRGGRPPPLKSMPLGIPKPRAPGGRRREPGEPPSPTSPNSAQNFSSMLDLSAGETSPGSSKGRAPQPARHGAAIPAAVERLRLRLRRRPALMPQRIRRIPRSIVR